MQVLELNRREADGLTVILEYTPDVRRVTLSVDDMRTGAHWSCPVPSERAADAFAHPFCYAPSGVFA
jgi:hypothetical protein